MATTFRCRSCGARFSASRRRCWLCGTVGAETTRDTCRDCGAHLVDSSQQNCPVCGTADVERVSGDRG